MYLEFSSFIKGVRVGWIGWLMERGLAVKSSDRKYKDCGFKFTAWHFWESVFTSSSG